MLSDACFDFLLHTSRGKPECETAARLLEDTIRYSKRPFNYGREIDRLREAVSAFLKSETAETRADLWRTARLVGKFHDGFCSTYDENGQRRPARLNFEIWAPAELEARPQEYTEAELRRHYSEDLAKKGVPAMTKSQTNDAVDHTSYVDYKARLKGGVFTVSIYLNNSDRKIEQLIEELGDDSRLLSLCSTLLMKVAERFEADGWLDGVKSGISISSCADLSMAKFFCHSGIYPLAEAEADLNRK